MRRLSVAVLLTLLLLPSGVSAAQFNYGSSLSSDTFRILDAQHAGFGGVASSSSGSFQLVAAMGDFAIGSSSLSTFGLRSGFLYYPQVIAPVLNTATAGNTQVTLSWTSAQAYQGWSVGGYNACTQPALGSFTCVDVGTATTFVKTGLTNGTSYTFHIEARDALGNIIAVSDDLSATPAGTAPTPTPSSGGGGGSTSGGYGTSTGVGTVVVVGTTSPFGAVTIDMSGGAQTTIIAGPDGSFQATLPNNVAGTQSVGVVVVDTNGVRSARVSYAVTVIAQSTVTVGPILVPPTIQVSPTQVAAGQKVRIFGQAVPLAQVSIYIDAQSSPTKVLADAYGNYALVLDTTSLTQNVHTVRARSVIHSLISSFSESLQFTVGKGEICQSRPDLNHDCHVNIQDFSILLFWWSTTSAKGLDIADLNDDRTVGIVDFSIMLYYWTD